MNAPHVNRHLRPQFCPDAVMGLVAIVAREAATSTSGSSSAADERDREGVDPEPWLSSYSAEERVPAPQLEGALETSDLVRLAGDDAGRGVRFVDISTRGNRAVAEVCIKRFAAPYPIVEDDNGRLLRNFRNIILTAVVPSSVIVARRGKVAAGVSGPVSCTTLGGFLEDEISATGTRP